MKSFICFDSIDYLRILKQLCNIYPSIVLYQNASRLAFENFLLMNLFPNDYSALTHLTRLYLFDREYCLDYYRYLTIILEVSCNPC